MVAIPTPALVRRPRSRKKRALDLAAYGFVSPFLVVFAAMLLVPLVYAAWLSLFRTQLIGGVSFVGLQNYVCAFTDTDFLAGVGRMALFLVVQVPIMLGLALFFALALDSGRVAGAKALRALIFVPYAIPGVVATLMWGYLYGRDFGPLAQVFTQFGLAAPDLLSTGNVLGSLMNVVTWEYIGYNMVILYAALSAVPAEMYEAAQIDGAGAIRIAWSIKIPAIRQALLLTVIFSIIGSFQLFNEPSLLAAIAPTAINSSYTPNIYAYNLAFVDQDVDYAAAIAFLLGLVIAIVSYVVQLGSRRRYWG